MPAYNGPFPGGVGAGSAFSEVNVHHTTFSGNVTNSGTISGGGIVVTSSTFLSGGIIDSGIDSGGIKVDSLSKISAHAGTAILVGAANGTFGGGISNAGALSGRKGIFASNISVFGGPGGRGISNSGKITANATAIMVENISKFTGGITNASGGTISSGVSFFGAIEVEKVTSFFGGIVNASGGLISGRGSAIDVFNNGTFAGGITNAGKRSEEFWGDRCLRGLAVRRRHYQWWIDHRPYRHLCHQRRLLWHRRSARWHRQQRYGERDWRKQNGRSRWRGIDIHRRHRQQREDRTNRLGIRQRCTRFRGNRVLRRH